MSAAISATHVALSKMARKTNAAAAAPPSFAKLAGSTRPADWKAAAGGSVRRQLGRQGSERVEGVPEARLRGLLVERLVDVRHGESLDRRRPPLEPAPFWIDGVGEREGERVEERHGALAHRDDELRPHDVELTEEERARLLLVAVGELEAVRPVDRHRVDAEALERLEIGRASCRERG